MLRVRCRKALSTICRGYATSDAPRSVPVLTDSSIETFRAEALEPATPRLLPRQSFSSIPAIRKWFVSTDDESVKQLNVSYLARFGANIVPLEITHHEQFARIEQPLSFFLECVKASSSTFNTKPSRYFNSYIPGAVSVRRQAKSNNFFSASTLTAPTSQVYLAQASLTQLPLALREDVPTPDLVQQAGKGDVYDSSLWLGHAPTYTPLHRDPNPNLFVQLAGRKIVRLFTPETGRAIFAKVQESIGGHASPTMRGEEMFQGAEKKALEQAVWDIESEQIPPSWEASLESGDALFIPKGYWHSVRGVGTGMTGSVNWWFR